MFPQIDGHSDANIWPGFSKNLNSRAFPEGSRRNIVHCSPGWPLNLRCGAISNGHLLSVSLSIMFFQPISSRIIPKWGTGTRSPSTRFSIVPKTSELGSLRWATSWWPKKLKSTQLLSERPSLAPRISHRILSILVSLWRGLQDETLNRTSRPLVSVN